MGIIFNNNPNTEITFSTLLLPLPVNTQIERRHPITPIIKNGTILENSTPNQFVKISILTIIPNNKLIILINLNLLFILFLLNCN